MNADELKQRRADLGLTQTELAKRLGVARNTVNRWEMGQRRIAPMVERLIKTIGREPNGTKHS